jgi:hypothetical protein
MLRLSGTTSFALVFALALCANPLFGQGQGVLQPDVDLIANSGPFEFDGLGPGMNLGRSSVFDVSGGDFTIHAWVRFASLPELPAPAMSIVDKIIGHNGPNEDGWRLIKEGNDNLFWFCLGGGSWNRCDPSVSTTVMSQTVAATDLWYSVAAVKTSSRISIYVNGVLEGSSFCDTFSDSNVADLLVGANHDEGAYLDGQVGEVQLFKSALSAPHVRALFEQSKLRYRR